MSMLEVKDLQVYYGVIQALKGISFEVEQGDVVALIGANGAGKTTTLHTITGLLPSKAGNITFEGTDITHVPGYKLVSMGIAHVPEGRRVFASLTVLQNLKMGAYTRNDKKEIEDTIEMIYKRFPRLKERKNQLAGTLSGGEQQMLAMGRALMSHPRLIVLDEPSMGLSPLYVNEIFDIIQEINKDGVTVLLVEQNAKKALSISNKAYVLETGNIVLSGAAKELIRKYLDENRGTLFPFISEQKYNVYIKAAFRKAGLTRMVTTIDQRTRQNVQVPICDLASSHMARRTFIGNVYKSVKDPAIVGAMSGHKDGSRAFARYRDIDMDIKRDAVSVLE